MFLRENILNMLFCNPASTAAVSVFVESSCAPETETSLIANRSACDANPAPPTRLAPRSTQIQNVMSRILRRRARSRCGFCGNSGVIDALARETLAGTFLTLTSCIFLDDILPQIAPEHFRHGYRTVFILIILHDLREYARERERGVVQGVNELERSIVIAIADVQAARLEIMEIR